MDELTKVQVYCCMVLHYYGFGLSPEAAVAACIEAGGKKSDARHPKRGSMKRLPEGVAAYAVDVFGTIHWRFAEGTPQERFTEQCAKLTYNKKTFTWEEAK